jgi:outer membrane protein OmpA-like peptidoglycan-associated protein
MIAENLSFNSILTWLGQHKADLSAALPQTLSETISHAGVNSSQADANTKQANLKVAAPRNKFIFPLILIALIGLGLVWWMNGCNQTSDESTKEAIATIDSAGISIDDAVNKASATIDSAVTQAPEAGSGKLDSSGNWIITKGDSIKIKLDNGMEISTFKGSLEDRFHAFVTDPAAIAGKDIWFNFEDILFESNKASLKKGYEKQLSNTVEILKAYPALKVKLGAYTDNTGDSLKNVKLSESRAKTVYNMLLSKGAAKTSFDDKPYEGYGPLYPVADNSTAEGRAQNRRISLSVRAK